MSLIRPADSFVSNTHFSDSISYSAPARTITAPYNVSILARAPHREFAYAHLGPARGSTSTAQFSACRTPNIAFSSSSRGERKQPLKDLRLIRAMGSTFVTRSCLVVVPSAHQRRCAVLSARLSYLHRCCTIGRGGISTSCGGYLGKDVGQV